MPRSINAVPAELAGRPFLAKEAYDLGVTRGALYGPGFRRVFQGVYAGADEPDTLRLRCGAAMLVAPPEAAFCGVTAAGLYGIPVPEERDGAIHMTLPPTLAARPATTGIVFHRYTLQPGDIQDFEGFRVIRPESLFMELAGVLGRVDLVVAGDQILRQRRVKVADLAELVATPGHWRRGTALARKALPLLDRRAASPLVSRLRMLIVDGGLPRPWSKVEVHDGQGASIGTPDLAYLEPRIAIDFASGQRLADRTRYEHDLARDQAYGLNGWLHLRYDSVNVLVGPHRILEELRRAGAGQAQAAPQTPDDD